MVDEPPVHLFKCEVALCSQLSLLKLTRIWVIAVLSKPGVEDPTFVQLRTAGVREAARLFGHFAYQTYNLNPSDSDFSLRQMAVLSLGQKEEIKKHDRIAFELVEGHNIQSLQWYNRFF